MAIKHIQIEGDSNFDFSDLYKKAYVNLDEEVKRPETILSVGEHYFRNKSYPNEIMTAGEFSVITAPSKTKKSFFKSALAASYIGGNANNYFSNIKSHRKEDVDIIDVDTEQSEFYAQRTFRRVFEMTGSPYENYHPLRLRFMTANERLQFLNWLLYSGKIKAPKLMFIDGVADLIDDTNDLVLSNEVASYLLRWTDELKIHICVIIHTAYGVNKPTGHLGSAVTKKAETVFNLSNDGEEFDSPTLVECSYSRGYPFEDFRFVIENALPKLYEDEIYEDPGIII